ncbi:MAG: HAMP domain-containing sensor histidine kinase [Prolixibacteraceae bacterium]
MNFYRRKKIYKFLLFLIATLIIVTSLLYTHWLATNIAEKERNSVSEWAEATKQLSLPQNDSLQNLNFLLNVIQHNTDIPIIQTDSALRVITAINIRYTEKNKDQVLKRKLKQMIREREPLRIDVSEKETQYLYYHDSEVLRRLKFFPVIQIIIISVFIMIAYFAFSASRQAEQNQVWMGMSKETAHQLGTPISSLMAWKELLKMEGVRPELIMELEKDINRLIKITDRFSKIGSAPELVMADIIPVITSTVSYLRNRTSPKIKFNLKFDRSHPCCVPHNPILMSWVFENLCKNAVDATGGEGIITIDLTENEDQLFIDVSDNGKGIPKSQFKIVFVPGFTTKSRGWGLGLPLVKRIIENYHRGKIFLKHSEVNIGSTFRIVLNHYSR